MRFKLTLEYDGSPYSGWQAQKHATTVQGTLTEAITRALEAHGGRCVDLQGAGRTDAGVHARGQVAHLDAETRLHPSELLQAINSALPGTINLLTLEPADPRFHARHWASAREYTYRISRRRNVFEKKFLYWLPEPFELAPMREAAAPLLGMHDFRAFSSKPSKEKSPRVLLEKLDISEQDEQVLIRVRGSHFLWNMVRNLTGALLEVGKGQLAPESLRAALEQGEQATQALTAYRAPANALFLDRVIYERPGMGSGLLKSAR